MHHDLTSCVFLQGCSTPGGPRCWCHHWTPQWWGAKLYLQPQALHSERGKPDPVPQTGSRTNGWLSMNCLEEKAAAGLRVLMWIGSCPQGHSWPRHSQRTQPALCILQSTATMQSTRCLNKWVFMGSFWLRDDITDYICVHFRPGLLLREKQFLANSSKCLPPTVWLKTVCSRTMGRCEFLSLCLLRIVLASANWRW